VVSVNSMQTESHSHSYVLLSIGVLLFTLLMLHLGSFIV
jgi:hypothetical protein